VVQASFGFDPVVVYGGGLKEENAGMISSIKTVGGGLVALTRFTGDIAFTPEGLAAIIAEYTSKGQ
ncbi:MAG: triosephosphate isomerase, partial [Betaproteobacteria bacterium]